MISELAQALYDKQQEERLKNSIKDLDKKLALGTKFGESFNPTPQQQPFFDRRNQQSLQKSQNPYAKPATQFAVADHLTSG